MQATSREFTITKLTGNGESDQTTSQEFKKFISGW